MITLIVTCPRTTDKATVKRDLGKFFASETQLVIGAVTYPVKYSMMDVIPYPYEFQATVTLKMTDPFGYSVEKSLTGSGTASNLGNYETYPTFTIPASTNPTVQVGTDVLTYTGTIAANHTVVVDCEKQTAVDGATNVIANVSGDWPVLEAGDNTITVAVAGTATTWKDKFV